MLLKTREETKYRLKLEETEKIFSWMSKCEISMEIVKVLMRDVQTI